MASGTAVQPGKAVGRARPHGGVLGRDNGVRGGSGRSFTTYGSPRSDSSQSGPLKDGYAALATRSRPGEAATPRQHASAMAAHHIGVAELHVPKLEGGDVAAHPEALGRELRARLKQAQDWKDNPPEGISSKAIALAETSLIQAEMHARVIEAQEAAPRARSKRGAEPELPAEFEADPDLAASMHARRKEAKVEGIDPAAADLTGVAEPAPTAAPTPSRKHRIDAGTVRGDGSGQVFDITRMRSAARPRAGAATHRPSTPTPELGFRGLTPHARTEYSNRAMETSRRAQYGPSRVAA